MTDFLDPETRKKVDALSAQGRHVEAVALLRTGKRRHKLAPGECKYCDGEKGDFHPSHDASDRCESGKHSHCTCDTCF